jgi:hypothetical protein
MNHSHDWPAKLSPRPRLPPKTHRVGDATVVHLLSSRAMACSFTHLNTSEGQTRLHSMYSITMKPRQRFKGRTEIWEARVVDDQSVWRIPNLASKAAAAVAKPRPSMQILRAQVHQILCSDTSCSRRFIWIAVTRFTTLDGPPSKAANQPASVPGGTKKRGFDF